MSHCYADAEGKNLFRFMRKPEIPLCFLFCQGNHKVYEVMDDMKKINSPSLVFLI